MVQELNIQEILARFNHALEQEILMRKVKLPYACCLSTEGTDGFPNARFVSLKEIRDEHFIITGTLTSRKGVEISNNEKVALTFWWPETQQQVRIQGIARLLAGTWPDHYFSERNRESQIVSVVSNQGEELTDPEELTRRFDEIAGDITAQEMKRPQNWGAYAIAPVRIEFLVFSESRFHDRTLFTLHNGRWSAIKLQP
ncbi:pyridoxamine 5'-phosphate oxidase [Chitinophaga sp. Mgbs1]|uniref:Pyridoxamine 5'-phosphate oxidase n=1 Tax=Chitinophaga solisilvae TaxID=1233460 RepID=A0A3S1AYM2_9BACT|nr:pyridoxamine 5'-phosphate oxidase [Chitinophaga solisilvae]